MANYTTKIYKNFDYTYSNTKKRIKYISFLVSEYNIILLKKINRMIGFLCPP